MYTAAMATIRIVPSRATGRGMGIGIRMGSGGENNAEGYDPDSYTEISKALEP